MTPNPIPTCEACNDLPSDGAMYLQPQDAETMMLCPVVPQDAAAHDDMPKAPDGNVRAIPVFLCERCVRKSREWHALFTGVVFEIALKKLEGYQAAAAQADAADVGALLASVGGSVREGDSR